VAISGVYNGPQPSTAVKCVDIESIHTSGSVIATDGEWVISCHEYGAA